MRQRCSNSNNHSAKHYYEKGITYDLRWKSHRLFIEDVGERPSPNHSLDRINNDFMYCKENVRWVMKSEQPLNTSRTVRYTIEGKTKTIKEWMDLYVCGESVEFYRGRIRRGVLSGSNIFTHPKNKPIKKSENDKRVEKLSKITGLTKKVINYRIKNGYSDEQIISTPKYKRVEGTYNKSERRRIVGVNCKSRAKKS